MEYRKLGRTGLDVSAIGLGTEHLERSTDNIGEILRICVESGVNYVDLLYLEPEYWKEYGSIYREHREKFVLAAHWGPNRDLDYCQNCLDNMLSYMGNDYVEIVMLTVVDKEETWNIWAQESMERLQPYKAQGNVGFIGMSGHTASTAMKAMNSGLIDVLMFHANPICNVYYEGNSELYQACADKGIGLVAMKPYSGGTLLYLDGKPTGIAPVQCLHYVLSLPVSTTVPGPKNVQELQATLHYLEASDEEKECSDILDRIHESMIGHCTYCNHCLPCPQNIDIGFALCLGDWAKGGINDDLLNAYADLPARASDCIECGQCVERCPFDVDIIPKMKQVAEAFESRAA